MNKISIQALDSVRDIELWKSLLRKLPSEYQDVYFTPEYHNLHVANGDGKGVCFHVTDGKHSLLIMGLMISILDGIYDLQTCNGYGGPISSQNAPADFLDIAWRRFKEFSKQSGIVAAFFKLHPLNNNIKLLPADATIRFDRKTVAVDVSGGIQDVWLKSDSRFRNRVSKARKQGIQVEWNTDNGWEQFPKLYAEAMERLSAANYLRFNCLYFKQLKGLAESSIAGIFECGKLLAGAVFLQGMCYTHYHLGARNNESENFLMNALFQAGLENTCLAGKSVVHFGGGRSSAADDNLLRFKKRTGGDLVEFNLALVVCCQETFKSLSRNHCNDKKQSDRWLLSYRQPL